MQCSTWKPRVLQVCGEKSIRRILPELITANLWDGLFREVQGLPLAEVIFSPLSVLQTSQGQLVSAARVEQSTGLFNCIAEMAPQSAAVLLLDQRDVTLFFFFFFFLPFLLFSKLDPMI